MRTAIYCPRKDKGFYLLKGITAIIVVSLKQIKPCMYMLADQLSYSSSIHYFQVLEFRSDRQTSVLLLSS